MVLRLLEGSDALPNLASIKGFEQLRFAEEGKEIRGVIRAGESGDFVFDFQTGASWTTAGSQIIVSFDQNV